MTELKVDGINVLSAETSTKLDVDGNVQTYEVFKIKLDGLYYNDRNGRIATWISKYTQDNGPIDTTDPSYNDIVAGFIRESNPDAIKRTRANIKELGQIVPGVVLRDGRIIDGNRRFTCLRDLAKDNPKFNYFEAVILDHDYTKDEKAIKSLELRLQHGVDKQVDYNPIDRLVDIYNDLVRDELFTPKEYARYTNTTPAKVNESIELANLLVDFLYFIKAPEQFYIARDMDLDGPLHEIRRAVQKVKDEEKKEEIKNAMFSALVSRPQGDMTRYVRKMGKLINSEESDRFLKEQEPIVDKIIDEIDSIKGPVNEKVLADKIQSNSEIKEQFNTSLNSTFDRYSATENRNEPIRLINNARDCLNETDLTVLKMQDPDKLLDIKTTLQSIEEMARKMKDSL